MNELKEILKPPFLSGGDYKWDWEVPHIRGFIDGKETAILKVMPIADRGYYENMLGKKGYKKFIGDLSLFVSQALEEKYERDFSEKKWIKKWIDDHEYLVCPVCDNEQDVYDNDFNFCPICGIKLQAE